MISLDRLHQEYYQGQQSHLLNNNQDGFWIIASEYNIIKHLMCLKQLNSILSIIIEQLKSEYALQLQKSQVPDL